MAKINVLPKNIAELIAAGEVCERPASVVKELLENSIDALADKITIEIRSGGIKYIRITDNGGGIAREDVPTAFLSHATSKIRTGEDLDAILTLGFRGEALASVCAVSKTEMLTKTQNEEFGTRYVIEGGEEKLFDDAGCPPGTTIIVRDLFYNTPARMKFLKKDMTEGNYVSDVVSKAALSHPGVSFRLIKDDKETLFTPGSGDLKEAIAAVHGRQFAAALIPCDYELGGVAVSGFVSKPLYARPNRNMQHFFANMRYVRIPFASAALDQAYKNSIMVGKFPSAVLFIAVPPGTLDVNVHPAKTEVRFADEKRVFDAVFYAVKNALGRGDTRPELHFSEKKQTEAYMRFLERHKEREQAKSVEQIRLDLPPAVPPKSQPPLSAATPAPTVTSDEPPALRDDSSAYISASAHPSSPIPSTKQSAPTEPVTPRFIEQYEKPAPLTFEKEEIEPPKQKAAQENLVEDFRIIGEAFQTYVLVEQSGKLLLIDKHAAHERMLFDALRAKKSAPHRQALLAPVSVTLSKKEYAAILENLPLLAEAGYAVEDFGEGTVMVREAPVALPYHEITFIIEELAGHLCEHVKELMPEKLDWLYHNTACRAAVKAGSNASAYELRGFVQTILSDPTLRYCPHGRPVLIEMSRYELEKQFGRIQ
ncbi:MAG: DNA mismatch repair endonuclease MutL [Oscillospiraceae bacterium]|jgi:DNA mismatch repair protein MutL|nr:DNA mismatch repair endonuclease MutL [Oscillospiraceae bacterium]